MAKDINSNKPRGAQKKDDDSAVLKIMIALLLLSPKFFALLKSYRTSLKEKNKV